MKKGWIVFFLIFFLVLSVAFPFIINESYKVKDGYITIWGAEDILLYFGTVISVLGTIFIGYIAIVQGDKANDINDRLMKLQEINSTPYLHIDHKGCNLQSYHERQIDFLLGVRNDTNGVINIFNVSNIHIDISTNKEIEIPFCKEWSTHFSVLPHEVKELNFMLDVSKDEKPIFDICNMFFESDFSQHICSVDLELGFVNSSDSYHQKIEFFLQIYKFSPEDKKYKFRIFNIENGISKKDDI